MTKTLGSAPWGTAAEAIGQISSDALRNSQLDLKSFDRCKHVLSSIGKTQAEFQKMTPQSWRRLVIASEAVNPRFNDLNRIFHLVREIVGIKDVRIATLATRERIKKFLSALDQSQQPDRTPMQDHHAAM